MISVMIPTRGRPELLASSIFSLIGRADIPGAESVEILVAVDNDDNDTLSMVDDLGGAGLIHGFWVTERLGYANLHGYYNALAEMARGEWLYQFNDDAVMLTDGWDSRIRDQKPEYVLQTIRKTRFPVVPALWVDAIGHYSLDRHCDTWWDEISRKLNRSVTIPVDGAHAVPNDQTAAEREYDIEGLLAKMDQINADATVIRGLL